jgi:plastocyanin
VTSSNNNSNFWWYIAAAFVIIIIIGIISYEVTLPPPIASPTTSPTPPVSTSPTPSTNASTTPLPSSNTSASPGPSPSGTGTALTLYAGAVTSGSGTYGFGDSASNIVSPGPTLNLKIGTTYTITVYNVATNMVHSWEIVSTKEVSNTPLFGAGIGVTNFINPGSSGSVTFTPDQAGNFYYVCTVPGHISLGMWGNVVVTS